MDFTQQITFTFNKFFYDFLKDVKETSVELKKSIKTNYKVKNTTTTTNLLHFSSYVTDEIYQKIVSSNPDELLLDSDIKKINLLKDISLEMILDNTPNEYHSTVTSYIYIFTLMNILFKQTDVETGQALFVAVMNAVRLMQKGEDYQDALSDVYDDDIKILVKNTSKVISSCSSFEDTTSGFSADMLENSKIGNLAKEITSEINFDDLNIDDSSNIMNLMNSNVLGNIMGKVGSKINEKIERGELKQEDLLGEALNFMKVLQQNGGGDNPLMNMMGNFMNKNAGKTRVDENKIKTMSARDRLRRKHEDKYGKESK
jgi:hypothetical protein